VTYSQKPFHSNDAHLCIWVGVSHHDIESVIWD